MKYVVPAALAVFIAGCSGVASLPSATAPSNVSNAAAPSRPFGKKVCRAKAVMQPGVAGFITLPSCFGISGKMQYPKAPESGITIAVTESKRSFKVYHSIPKTVLILQWEFTDAAIATGTVVVFDYTHTGSTAPDKVGGPFKSSQTYRAVFECPIPTDPKPDGGIAIAGTTVGHSVIGIPFPGTQVEIGVKNYEIFTTDPNPPK